MRKAVLLKAVLAAALGCGAASASVVYHFSFEPGAALGVQPFSFSFTLPDFLTTAGSVPTSFDVMSNGDTWSMTRGMVSDASGFSCYTFLTSGDANFDPSGCGGGLQNPGHGGMVWFFGPSGSTLPSATGDYPVDAIGVLSSGEVFSSFGDGQAALNVASDAVTTPEPALGGAVLGIGAALVALSRRRA